MADGSNGGGETQETPQRERSVVRWVLLDGPRWIVTVLVSALVFLTLVALGLADVIGVGSGSLTAGIFTASITGVFTLVSITITINQLVLSRILGSPELIQERIDSVHDFRSGIADMVPDVVVSPTQPAAFLELVTHALAERTRRLESVYADHHDAEVRRALTDLEETLTRITDDVDERIHSDSLNLFAVLSPILNNEFSEHLNTVRRIRASSEDLSREEMLALDDLEEALVEINRTRHYFKTLYLHEELADLSRQMLLTGIPAIVAAFVGILGYDGVFPTLSEPLSLVVLSALLVLVLLPLTVLLSGSLRFITIAKRTTTFGTFTPPEEMP